MAPISGKSCFHLFVHNAAESVALPVIHCVGVPVSRNGVLSCNAECYECAYFDRDKAGRRTQKFRSSTRRGIPLPPSRERNRDLLYRNARSYTVQLIITYSYARCKVNDDSRLDDFLVSFSEFKRAPLL